MVREYEFQVEDDEVDYGHCNDSETKQEEKGEELGRGNCVGPKEVRLQQPPNLGHDVLDCPLDLFVSKNGDNLGLVKTLILEYTNGRVFDHPRAQVRSLTKHFKERCKGYQNSVTMMVDSIMTMPTTSTNPRGDERDMEVNTLSPSYIIMYIFLNDLGAKYNVIFEIVRIINAFSQYFS